MQHQQTARSRRSLRAKASSNIASSNIASVSIASGNIPSVSIASIAIAAFCLACSSGQVDLGDGTLSQNLEPTSRCGESTSIAEDFQIDSQSELDELRGCEQVKSIAIAPFEGIDLTALSSLRSVGRFEIGADPFTLPESYEEQEPIFAARQAILDAGWLPSLHGLEALESIEVLYLTGAAIEDFKELESLTTISQGLLPRSTHRLRNFRGLERAPVTFLWVSDAPALTSLDGLDVPPLAQTIIIERAENLANADVLAEVTSLDTLILNGTRLAALPSFVQPLGAVSISIEGNAELTSIDSLAPLQGVGNLTIAGNAKLRSIPRFADLVSIETFSVIGNASLEEVAIDFPAQEPQYWNLRQRDVEIHQPIIEIALNDTLKRITSPGAIESLELLSIEENPQLTDVDLGGLERTDLLLLLNNASLENVTAPALAAVDNLEVTDNPRFVPSVFDDIPTFSRVISGNAAPAASDAPDAPDAEDAPTDDADPDAPAADAGAGEPSEPDAP